MQTTIIRCRQVHVQIEGQAILTDINLDIPEHCLLPVVGPNGSGKTTLLRAILGLVRLSGGDIDTPFRSRRPRYVSQVKNIDPIYPVSVRQLVQMGANPSVVSWKRFTWQQVQAVDNILDDFQLTEHQHKTFSQLSGGMKQKTLLARAFAAPADVLLLDEPTSELDQQTEQHVIQRLMDMRHRCTIIWVHHNMFRALRITERVCLVNNGTARIVSSKNVMHELSREPVR
jgi:zinc transport system ATP-binding protein